MNILDRILNFFKRNKPKMLNSGKFEMQSIDRSSVIQIWDCNKIKTVKNFDKLTQLILAKIKKQNIGDVDLINYNDFVAFEIPEGIQISPQILQKVAEEYDRKIELNSKEYCTYLGSIDLTPDKGLQFTSKDEGVQSYIDRKVKPKLAKESNGITERKETKSSAQKVDFMKQIDVRDTINYISKIKQERLSNPFFKFQNKYVTKNGTECSEYKGVNMQNGEILNINSLTKIGKALTKDTGLSTYLYTAIVSSAQDTNDVNVIDTRTNQYAGNYVCFELPNDIERILPYMQKEHVINLLNLLSRGANVVNPNELTYIGSMDAYGNVYNNTRSYTEDVQNKIEQLKESWKNNRNYNDPNANRGY